MGQLPAVWQIYPRGPSPFTHERRNVLPRDLFQRAVSKAGRCVYVHGWNTACDIEAGGVLRILARCAALYSPLTLRLRVDLTRLCRIWMVSLLCRTV